MKHFLKPLGHCLTTAVMTSAMLRVYALPAEAAAPDVEPQPASDTATAEAAALAAPNLSVSAPVAQPEVIDVVEAAPVLEPAVTPEPALAAVSSPVAESVAFSEPASMPVGGTADTPVDAPIAEPARDSENMPTKVPVAEPEADPAAVAQPSQPTVKPEAETITGSGAEDAKQTPAAATQKPNINPTRTVAGMRQIVEKRLETIVGQDKASREAQWQQNMIRVALDYAWQGKFEAARKVAANSALPLELQISLLGKIAAIETEFLAAQAAQLPNVGNQPQAKRPGQAATPQGRVVPSGYSTAEGRSVPAYAGLSLTNQCSALESPPNKSVAPPQTSPRPTATAKPTGGIPDFVPALGQNLAARLAQLSRTQTAPVAAKPVTPTQPLVSPELFAGVAANSVQAQPSKITVPLAPKPSQPQATLPQTTIQPVAVTAHSQVAEPPFAERLFPSPPSPPIAAASQDSLRPTDTALPLEDFQPFGFAFPELFDSSLDWVWNWWNVPTPDLEEPTARTNSTPQLSATAALPLSAEVGLTNPQFWQSIEQSFTTERQPLRNVRKLSISLPSAKNATLKAPLKAPIDSQALLAISCNRVQLGQSSWTDALISPATAKQFGWVNFMFPLPIPAVITSAFGWRTHPISGDLRFHTGLDIGAPMGTPVLSAAQGRVVVADAMGGYGLAVVVENEATHQRNLYAHLSGIAVQPGATVEPGTVLGWVGSTGNSTGPHLHFEAQVKTENGWTVIDPLASAAVTVAQNQQD